MVPEDAPEVIDVDWGDFGPPSTLGLISHGIYVPNAELVDLQMKQEYLEQLKSFEGESIIICSPHFNQQGSKLEGNQTQRQNAITWNSHTVMVIDIESEGRDINPPHLEAKINQASFNRQRDYWATKSNLLKQIVKQSAGQHHPGYGEGLIEVQDVVLRHARGEIISIAD
ncbi:MAG: hypothetical protein EZS28_011967 [Streblomastix strix]|uniref:Uncharacterized protein n=1 Tax=Streblomastix strix TaxID=222440 RepID=A0A5J4WC35_9EUKA|nr:MAG: hypothetical protein EZS28_011967 [Streblomastix strix]